MSQYLSYFYAPVLPMDATSTSCYADEKYHEHEHEHEQQVDSTSPRPCCSDPKACHRSRTRRLLVPALLAFLASGAILLFACTDSAADLGMGLLKRATSEGGNNSTFVDRKYYLIIVFVGLVIVVILGLCLSAWCCRGSFENPLCCPCYLCACCGGLACLECIGCGLCAEGLEQA